MSKVVKIHDNKATNKIRTPEAFSRFDDNKIRKNDHLEQVTDLMYHNEAAIRLQIDNLVLTYGIQAVRKAVKTTDLKLIQKCKKVA